MNFAGDIISRALSAALNNPPASMLHGLREPLLGSDAGRSQLTLRLESKLEEAGYRVRAPNAEEALRFAVAQCPKRLLLEAVEADEVRRREALNEAADKIADVLSTFKTPLEKIDP